ncbi:MAG TPA: SRPBCC family protein [Candidatus Limnocylindrales bacterium]
MSVTWGGSIVLPQAPETVWAFLTTDANDATWRRPWVISVRALSEGPFRVGSRYETWYRFFGRPQRTIVETTVLEPPRRVRWSQVEDPTIASNVVTYDLEPVDGGTRFTVTGVFESAGWRRVIDRPFAWYLNHGPVQRQHAQLRAALAAAQPSAR